MNRIHRIHRLRRVAATLAGLALTWLGLAVAAPAALARIIPPPGGMGSVPASAGLVTVPPSGAVTVTRTVVVGGMAGWQIALIAAGAALRRPPPWPSWPTGPWPSTASPPCPPPERTRVALRNAPISMDYHPDLKLPDEAIAQIADDTRHERADQFGVRQLELYHNADGAVYCLLEGPDEEAIRRHHAALGVPCGDIHQVDTLT